jgi:hypothetical protein
MGAQPLLCFGDRSAACIVGATWLDAGTGAPEVPATGSASGAEEVPKRHFERHIRDTACTETQSPPSSDCRTGNELLTDTGEFDVIAGDRG